MLLTLKHVPVCSVVLLLGLFVGLAAPLPARAAPTTSAVSTSAVEGAVAAPPSSRSPMHAVHVQSWLGNRTRMIQFALVAVALGIFILHRK
jgi:hypothetical protein